MTDIPSDFYNDFLDDADFAEYLRLEYYLNDRFIKDNFNVLKLNYWDEYSETRNTQYIHQRLRWQS